MEAARARKGGRRSGLSTEAQKKSMLAEMYYKEEKIGVDEIAETIGVSKMTLYKYLRLRGVPVVLTPKKIENLSTQNRLWPYSCLNKTILAIRGENCTFE